jgi:hypothetical protein
MNTTLTKLAIACVHSCVSQKLTEKGKEGAYKYAALIEASLGRFLDYKGDVDRMSISESDIAMLIGPTWDDMPRKVQVKLIKEVTEQVRILNGRMKSTEKFLRDQLQLLDGLSEQMQEELYKHSV